MVAVVMAMGVSKQCWMDNMMMMLMMDGARGKHRLALILLS